MPPSEAASKWAEYAEQDFRAMMTLMASEDPVFPIICFLAQQAVEKYLKAFLVQHGVEPQRSHDLNSLRSECAALDADVGRFVTECSVLNNYAVSPRYPMGIARPGEVEAQAAVAAAERIRAVIRQHMGM